MCDTSLFTECFDVVEPTPLFQLAIVGGVGKRARPGSLSGLGSFGDLHRILLEEVVR
jgi:hypothetical protein